MAWLPFAWSSTAPVLEELVVIADAIRAMQRSDGTFVSSEATQPLVARSQVLMDRLLSDPALTAEGVQIERLGADIWTSMRVPPCTGSRPGAYLHWGPLGTWRSKSTEMLHSFVLAIADSEMDALVAKFDQWALPDGSAYLNALLSRDDIGLTAPPEFLCSQVVLRGGEAGIPPYHFAYFFPEDEGIAGPGHAALVFTNGYRSRYEKISLPLAHRLLGASRRLETAAAFPGQLLWLRGHDICHGVHVRGTNWDQIGEALGPRAVAVLGEVVADVFGYLLLSAAPICEDIRLDEEQIALSFMAELLQYLRREPHLFPDTAAACIELNYLVQHASLVLKEDLSLDWSARGLRAGFQALATDLLNEVLSGDVASCERFLDRYSSTAPRASASISPLLHLLGHQLPHIPTIAAA